MYKKLISILLAALLVMGLAACGNSEQDEKFDALVKKTSEASSEVPQAEESASSQPESHEEVDDTAVSSKTPIVYDRTVQYVEWGDLFNLEPNTELSGTLTIRAYYSAAIEPWVKEFMATYPNVKIRLDVHPVTSNEDAQKLAVELNSGTAGDIVMMGLVSNYKYAESGIFLDMYPFMEADPDFHMEDYYTNIFKAMETSDGKMCTMVPFFTTPCVFFNTGVTDKLGVDFLRDYPDGMTYKEIVALYNRAIEEGALPEGAPLSTLGSKDYLGDIVIMDYLDEANHISNLDSPGFIEYLETANSIPAGVELAWDAFAVDYDFQAKNEFLIRSSHTFELLSRYLYENKEMHNSMMVPCRTESGKNLFEALCSLGITSACENPELAWEFIKFMISEKPFPEGPDENGEQEPAYGKIYRNCTPVNRKNCENLCRALCEDDELIEYVIESAEKCDTERSSNGELAVAWSEIRKNFFQYGLISAEECAKQMQERTWIYMNE